MTLAQRPCDEQLSAWLDGEGSATERAAIAAWLDSHPDEAARVQAWTADRDTLRAAFGPVLDEALPPHLVATARHGGPRRTPLAMAAAATGLLLAGGLIGAWLSTHWAASDEARLAVRTPPEAGASAPSLDLTAAPMAWTQRAAVAHAVYAPEVRHPVEVSVVEGNAAEQRAQEQHLARWLTKRLDMPVRLFDLRTQGFELVGGRLLPDASGPSAQLMYQSAQGERITVYLRKPEAGTHTAFRFQRDGALGLFYWVEDGQGCALVGALPRERLLAAAEAVYQQMEAAARAPAEPAAPAPAPAAQPLSRSSS